MGDLTTIDCVKHIETYVDSSSSKSPAQQDASLDAIAKLLMSDMLTLESLVREMGMYLTTTDNIIRARGILLLAELLTRISSKPLENATVQSLIGFFSERLSDWRALRGSLVGCLALMRRSKDIGAINTTDASAIAQSFMENLQVQSLGQHDRKLCFEILECLMDCYPDSLMTMEDDFVYAVCEAIDGEKDPECLLLTFHLVEMVAKLYPDSSTSLQSYAEDLFNILGSYFPIHFTHPKGEDDVKREELSRALMLAFGSTPLFEPFAIPLLLEKLSSSLPSSKVESLKYLSYCTVKYTPQRMLQHHEPIWSSLKDTIFTLEEKKILSESLILLQNLIQQDNGIFVNLIIKDADINLTFNSLSNYNNFNNITLPDKQRLNAIGQILHVSTKSSIASCNAIFQTFFPTLVNNLGSMTQEVHKFGYLYILVELLAACRNLVMKNEEHKLMSYTDNGTWDNMLHSLCGSLTSSLVKSIKETNEDAYSQLGVKGLKILASFPGSFLAVPKSTFENILEEFVSIIILKLNNTSLWGSVLNALIEIGSFIKKIHDIEKMGSFDVIVVEKMVDLLSSDDSTMPFSLKVKVVSEIGMINQKYMMKIIQELNKAIFTTLHKSWFDGNSKSTEQAIVLLECYTEKVLPWFENIQDSDDVAKHFALKIWDEIQDSTLFVETLVEKKLLETTMNTMKHTVATCSEDSQSMILDKALTILSSGLPPVDFSCKDEWIMCLFDAIIISLHPKTQTKNPEKILEILMGGVTNGHATSAHALGSFFNKIPSNESIDVAFNHLTSDRNSRLSNVNEIVGLAWMGKGLLMRGHEKVKDVIKFFLNFLISNQDEEMRVVADSFGVMMSDSDACLNKRFNAIIRPLYKQRLFSIVMPILQSSIANSDSPITRCMLHRALAHVIYNTPLSAVMGEAKKLIPLMVDGLTILSEDVENRDIVYNLLLVLSGILTDKNGEEGVVENAYVIIRCLNKLVVYPHMMLVRETAIQCLTATSELPHSRVYPFRTVVVQALLKALDDPKRSVRQEAVKCRQAWVSISSRTLHI